MASKNGPPELISLLQYMKKTSLENPEVVIQDERMKKLDTLVTEVKESEEWEAVSMSIYSVAFESGLADGRMEGLTQGQIELVCKKLRKGKSIEIIADELEEEVDAIRPIYELARSFAPEYNSEEVVAAWFQSKDEH